MKERARHSAALVSIWVVHFGFLRMTTIIAAANTASTMTVAHAVQDWAKSANFSNMADSS